MRWRTKCPKPNDHLELKFRNGATMSLTAPGLNVHFLGDDLAPPQSRVLIESEGRVVRIAEGVASFTLNYGVEE